MFRKAFLIPAVIGIGGLLMMGGSANAQHRGQSGGHAPHVSHRPAPVVHNHGIVHYGNVYHGGYYNRSYWPRYGYGAGYWPYYNSYAYPSYSYPSYSYPSYSYYYAPPTVLPAAAESATIRVIVPDPYATVWLNGQPMSLTGTDRVFTTPIIAAGSSLSYQVRATWMEGYAQRTATQTVTALPGGTFVVDFTNATSRTGY